MADKIMRDSDSSKGRKRRRNGNEEAHSEGEEFKIRLVGKKGARKIDTADKNVVFPPTPPLALTPPAAHIATIHALSSEPPSVESQSSDGLSTPPSSQPSNSPRGKVRSEEEEEAQEMSPEITEVSCAVCPVCSTDVRQGGRATPAALAKHLRDAHTLQEYAHFRDGLKGVDVGVCTTCLQAHPITLAGGLRKHKCSIPQEPQVEAEGNADAPEAVQGETPWPAGTPQPPEGMICHTQSTTTRSQCSWWYHARIGTIGQRYWREARIGWRKR